MADAADFDLDECFEVISALVDEAGKIVRERNSSRKAFACKSGEIDLVTATDREVERLLMDGILSIFPDHKFIAEEESSTYEGPRRLTDAPTWIIDPVDGTMNFVHGFPHSCISVSLKVHKVTEIGIIYNPILMQRFTARRGQGAYYNGHRMAVSTEKELSKALIMSDFGTCRDPIKQAVVMKNFERLAKCVHGIRTVGACALNMSLVALGAADAFYDFGVHVWDVCAADLIVREAGGVVLDPSGGEFDSMSRRVLAAATRELAQQLSGTILHEYYPVPRDDDHSNLI